MVSQSHTCTCSYFLVVCGGGLVFFSSQGKSRLTQMSVIIIFYSHCVSVNFSCLFKKKSAEDCHNTRINIFIQVIWGEKTMIKPFSSLFSFSIQLLDWSFRKCIISSYGLVFKAPLFAIILLFGCHSTCYCINITDSIFITAFFNWRTGVLTKFRTVMLHSVLVDGKMKYSISCFIS